MPSEVPSGAKKKTTTLFQDFPFKRTKFDFAINSQGQRRVIIYINFVVLASQMLHTKSFKAIGLVILENKIFFS